MNNRSAFTLVEIMIVLAIIAILAAIAIPALIESRKEAKAKRCMYHQQLYERAKEQSALNLGASSGTVLTYEQVEPFIKGAYGAPAENFQCPIVGAPLFTNDLTYGAEVSCSIHGSVSNPTALSAITDD